MKLLPLDRPEFLELVAGWLARKENYQWLDFGNGRRSGRNPSATGDIRPSPAQSS
jgi:hypothetical protein